MLEASLCFRNGMVIPLMSEFLEYETGDGEASEQDGESAAFHRLAARIKKAFPPLPIVLLLDGLYPNGPIMERCRSDRWGIEGAFLVEKHQGYAYEHAFAKNWNATKGYHYLARAWRTGSTPWRASPRNWPGCSPSSGCRRPSALSATPLPVLGSIPRRSRRG